MKQNTKRYLLLASCFTLFFCCIYFFTLDHKLDLNGDNAIYIQLARNMSHGLGYSNVTVNSITPASHFPPGYSALLSVFIKIGIDNLLFFKVLNGLFLLVSLFLLIYMVGKITKQLYFAFAISALACFSPQLLHFAGIAMSEMSYLFCTMMSLFALFMYDQKGSSRFWSSPWFYIAIVTGVAAYHIRTIGASILFAIVVFYLFRKEWWATASSAVLSIILLLPWMLRNKHLGIESRYFGTIMTVNPWRPEEGTISSFSEMIDKMLTNIDETVLKGFRELLFPFISIDYQNASSLFGIIAGLIVVGLVFYGAWNMGKLRWSIMAFLLANIGLFALWHGGNGSRYVVPIEPLLYFCFFTGIVTLCIKLVKRAPKADTLWALLFLIFALPSLTPVKSFAEESKLPYPPNYGNYFAIAKLMNDKAPKGVVVSCRKPELFMYYAPKIVATRYMYSQDTNEVIADLISRKVDYVILDQLGYSSTARYLYPAIQANMDLFEVIWAPQNPDTYLLRFNRELAQQRLTAPNSDKESNE